MSSDMVVVKVPLGGGKVTDERTGKALKEAQRVCGVTFSYAQGSYNDSVGASAGTHDLGAVVDIKVPWYYTKSKRDRMVRGLRRVGFAAWFRPTRKGVWGQHIHAVCIQSGGRYDKGLLAPLAFSQVADYYQGLDGLSGHGPDPHRGMGIRPVTFERWKQRPVVSLTNLGRGKPAHPDVKVVQRALNWVMGLDLELTGVWDQPTITGWESARRRFGLRRGDLLTELGVRYCFRATA